MIQRKQTLYLIFSLLLFLCLFGMPLATLQVGTLKAGNVNIFQVSFDPSFSSYMPLFEKFNYLFIILQILTTLFSSLLIVAILMFKKRSLQVRLCAFAFMANILTIGAIFLTGSMIEGVDEGLKLNVHYALATYFPLVTPILVMLAQRAIRRDEMMVQSLNRLR